MREAQIFVRRYTPNTRPWNPFHHDSAVVTVNVALSADADVDGGKLVAVGAADGLATICRAEGEATVHDSRLLHAVTRTRAGTRYSLILFFGRGEGVVDDATAQAGRAFDTHLASLPAPQRREAERQLAALEAPMADALRAGNPVFAASTHKICAMLFERVREQTEIPPLLYCHLTGPASLVERLGHRLAVRTSARLADAKPEHRHCTRREQPSSWVY